MSPIRENAHLVSPNTPLSRGCAAHVGSCGGLGGSFTGEVGMARTSSFFVTSRTLPRDGVATIELLTWKMTTAAPLAPLDFSGK